jgi:hypothetical protein
MKDSRPAEISFSREKGALETTPQENRRAELLALFRLLVREPPKDHDFRACPICKGYGITKI